jgi:hypothetical protein
MYREHDDGLLVDLSIDDEAFLDAPAARDGDWVAFVEGHEGGYRAESRSRATFGSRSWRALWST